MKTIFVFIFCAQIFAIRTSIKSNGSRIIGGDEATAGQFPFAAAIYKTTTDGTYFCTGTIITSEWIITAGQCVSGATSFTILVGTHKLDGDEVSRERLSTNEYVLHPEFNSLTLQNDIGLIKLRLPLTFNTYIRNMDLPFYDFTAYSVGTTYGWGQTADDSAGLSNTLHFVRLTIVSEERCRITYGSQLYKNMVCFEGLTYNEETCYGDSGSPMIEAYRGHHYMVAAVSSFFSANGCESTDPSGYTNVYPYNDWIKNVSGIV